MSAQIPPTAVPATVRAPKDTSNNTISRRYRNKKGKGNKAKQKQAGALGGSSELKDNTAGSTYASVTIGSFGVINDDPASKPSMSASGAGEEEIDGRKQVHTPMMQQTSYGPGELLLPRHEANSLSTTPTFPLTAQSARKQGGKNDNNGRKRRDKLSNYAATSTSQNSTIDTSDVNREVMEILSGSMAAASIDDDLQGQVEYTMLHDNTESAYNQPLSSQKLYSVAAHTLSVDSISTSVASDIESDVPNSLGVNETTIVNTSEEQAAVTAPPTEGNYRKHNNNHKYNKRGKDVCRFFLKGHCKFHDNCKYSHDIQGNGSYNRGGRQYHNNYNNHYNRDEYRRYQLNFQHNNSNTHNIGTNNSAMSSNDRYAHNNTHTAAASHASACAFWKNGRCRYGTKCNFSHIGMPGINTASVSMAGYNLGATGYYNPQQTRLQNINMPNMAMNISGLPAGVSMLPNGALYGYYQMASPHMYETPNALSAEAYFNSPNVNPEMLAQLYQLPPPAQFYAPSVQIPGQIQLPQGVQGSVPTLLPLNAVGGPPLPGQPTQTHTMAQQPQLATLPVALPRTHPSISPSLNPGLEPVAADIATLPAAGPSQGISNITPPYHHLVQPAPVSVQQPVERSSTADESEVLSEEDSELEITGLQH